MVLMKKLLSALLLFLLAVSCSAASINVQNAVPADTVWSFSVTLPDAGDFDEAEIMLDGSSLVTLYTRSNKILVDVLNETKVLSNAVVGSSVYLSIAAVGKGTHSIRLVIDGEEEASKEVLFFEVLAAEDQPDLQSQINSLHGSINSLIEQFNELDERAGGMLKEEDRQQLQAGIDELSAAVNSLEAQLQQQQVAAEQAEAELASLQQQAQALGRKALELDETIASGLFGLASNPKAGLSMVIIIVAAVVIVLVVRNREKLQFKKGLYESHRKEEQEPVVFSESEEEITGEVLQEEQGKSGKWAFKGKKAGPRAESKRFHLSDLLKKE